MTGNKIFLPEPDANQVESYTLDELTSGAIQFKPEDISGLSLGDAGELIISLKNGGQVVLENYEELAANEHILTLEDGTIIDPSALSASAVSPQQLNSIQAAAGTETIQSPEANTTQEISLTPGQKYVCDFDPTSAAKVEVIDGQMVLTFNDGSRVVINNYDEVMAGDLPAELTLSDGQAIDSEELLTQVTEVEQPIEEILEVASTEDSAEQVANIEPAAGEDSIAQQVANIEPAAGEAPGASNTGFGFGSTASSDPLVSPDAIGPLGPTALQFGLPQVQQQNPLPQANNALQDSIPNVSFTQEAVDETNLQAGNIVVGGTLNVDYGNDVAGTIVINNTFTAGGELDNGALTHNGVPVTVAPNANGDGYVGTAGGVTVFEFTVDNAGVYEFTLLEQLDHADTTNDNEAIQLDFGITVTDGDGDSVPASIRINVLDDAPIVVSQTPAVVDETNLDAGALTASGQFFYDVGQDAPETVTVNGTFQTSGEVDNGVLTSNGNPVVTNFDANTNTYTGTIFTGTANEQTVFTNVVNPTNGTFDYTQFAPLDHANPNDPDESLTLQFGVTVTDFDGDSRDGFVSVEVRDDAPETGDDVNTIDETNLDAGSIVVRDSVSVDFGEDGPGELLPSGTFAATGSVDNGALTHGGVPVTVTQTANGYVGTAGTTVVFTLDIDSSTGDYTFTLLESLDHADNSDPNDSITLTFGTVISDFDDDTETGEIVINVLDDAPTINQPNGPQINEGLENVDETDLDNGVITETGTLPVDFGQDGPGEVTGTNTFAATGSVAGGALTSCGHPVVVTFDSNTNTYTGVADGQTVFSLEINPTTGEYTYTQPGTLDHADGTDPNDVITLTFGVEVSDSEGEAAQGSVVINVADDAPELDPVQDTVDETDLGLAGVSVNGMITADYGQDGAAAANPFEASGNFTSSGSQAGNALTHNGTPVVVTFDSNTNTYTGVAGAVTVFTMVIDEANAEYDFTLLATLDHADSNDPNDIINLDFGIQATDKDGDTSESFVRIQVKDDVPTIGDSNGDVDETNFDNGPLVYSDTLQTDAGLDLASVDGNDTFTSSVPLTSAGAPVVVTSVGNTYTGTVNGQTAFTLVVDPTTGQYTYTQLLPLDHPDSADANDTIDLSFGVQITDNDGDTDTGTVTITVADDGPVARDDINGAEEGQLITGDVIANDDLSQDVQNLITNVNFEGTDFAVPATGSISITGNYGTLVISQDGTYEYTTNNNDPDGVDVFTYTLTDFDGDTDTATLSITVTPDGQPVAVSELVAVDETNLTPGPSILNGDLNVEYGLDGTGSVVANNAFSASGSVANGALTSNGVPVVVTLVGDTFTGVAGTDDIFTLVINTDGTYTFELLGTLDHADGTDPNDLINLEFGVTAIDADGDTADGTLTVRVYDDAPVAIDDGTTNVNEGASVNGNVTTNDELSEDAANNVTSVTFGSTTVAVPTTGSVDINGNFGVLTLSADGSYTYAANVTANNVVGTDTFTYSLTDREGDTDTAEFSFDVAVVDDQPVVSPVVRNVDETGGFDTVTGTVAVDFGSDLPGDINPNGSFSSSVTNLTACDGHPITVSLAGDVYTGTALINGQTVTIFTLEIENDGAYAFTQFEAIDHPDTVDHNDNVALTFGVSATDGDGDVASSTITVNVRDDGPEIDQSTAQVDEAQLANQNSLSANGVIAHDFGQDGAGEITANGLFNAKFQMNGSAVNLTSDGNAVTVTSTDSVYTGTANGQVVFTLTINPATGAYNYQQFSAIDHPDGSNPDDVIWLEFHVDIEDKDGDTDSGVIVIDVQDDGPVARDDTDSVSTTETRETGNVLSNDSFGADGQGQLLTTGTFVGNFGTLVLNSNGAYTYTRHDTRTDGTDTFDYTIRDNDGDTSTATLSIDVTGQDFSPINVSGLGYTDDSNLRTGDDVENGTINVDYQGDGPGTTMGTGAFGSSGSQEGGTLTHNGVRINVSYDANSNTYTGKAGSKTIFTMKINSNGTYSFRQIEELDHGNTNSSNEAINLYFGVKATDADGDSGTGNVRIIVRDDGVHARDDTLNVGQYAGQSMNLNVLANDTLSQDSPNTIVAVSVQSGSTAFSMGQFNQFVNDSNFRGNGSSLSTAAELQAKINSVTAAGGTLHGLFVADVAGGVAGGNTGLPYSGAYAIFNHGDRLEIYTIATNWHLNKNVKINYRVQDGDGDESTASLYVQGFHSPLALDLDGDGIELLNAQDGVLFDIDGDGINEQTGWVAADDGLLVLDKNGDGIINDNSELFGNTVDERDGFSNLANYDSNGDGVIDANDDIYSDLLVWQDLNSDGISDANEMLTLEQIGIVSISLNAAQPDDLYIEGNWISHISTFTTADGETHEIVDAWFATDGNILGGTNEADNFIFQAIQDSAIELRNFDLAEDSMDLSALIDGEDDLSDAINEFVYATEVDGSTIISVDIDGADGPAEAQEVAILQGITGVNVDDLINNGNIDV